MSSGIIQRVTAWARGLGNVWGGSPVFDAYYRLADATYAVGIPTPKRTVAGTYWSYEPTDAHGDDPGLAALDALPTDATVIDVGAHVGEYAIPLAVGTDRTVVAFEPNGRSADRFRRNRGLNDLDDRVQLRRVGLGATTDTVPFYRSTFSKLSSFDRRRAARWGGAVAAVETVPVRQLDTIVDSGRTASDTDSTDLWPDGLKIDVEGDELAVLRGGAETIAAARPLIVLEYHGDHDGVVGNRATIRAWLDDRNYEVTEHDDTWICRPRDHDRADARDATADEERSSRIPRPAVLSRLRHRLAVPTRLRHRPAVPSRLRSRPAVPSGLARQFTLAALLGALGLVVGAALLVEQPAGWLLISGVVATLLWGYTWAGLPDNHRPDADDVYDRIGTANVVTLVRGLLLAGVAGFLLADPVWAWLPATLFVLVALLDAVDGAIARRTRQTRLGARLDTATDAGAVLIGAAVAVAVGSLPTWYLLAGVVWYGYVGGLWLRRRRHAPVHELPESRLRPLVGAAQLGVIGAALLPGVTTSETTLPATVALLALLASFGRDWMAVTGRLNRLSGVGVTADGD